LRTAVVGSLFFALGGTAIYVAKLHQFFGGSLPWLTGALALFLIFGVGFHIVRMAAMALVRGMAESLVFDDHAVWLTRWSLLKRR